MVRFVQRHANTQKSVDLRARSALGVSSRRSIPKNSIRLCSLVAKDSAMHPILTTILLLTASNIFMTFAWYAHLKHLGHKPLMVAVLVSWGIAFFEYLIQVPANRIGFGQLSLPQLKMLQEVITLSVFVPFSVFYMNQPVRLDFLWAGLCLCGAVFFMFRSLPVTG
jgi:uncharacterized protein (DUF486 family)